MMLKKLINISLRAIIGLLIIVFLYCFIGYLWPSQALPQANHPHPTIILSDPTIVDIENNKLICHQSILIQEGVIQSIARYDSLLKVEPRAFIIDLQGSYVIPGLWDMHVHTIQASTRLHFPLLFANGVLGIREKGLHSVNPKDPFFTQMEHKQVWNDQIRNGTLIGPKVMAIASHVIEDEESLAHFPGKNLSEKVRSFVRESTLRGADFIKVQLKGENAPAIFTKLINNVDSLKVLGHLPNGISLHEAAEKGFYSLEHAKAILLSCAPLKDDFTLIGEHFGKASEAYKKEKAAPILSSMAKNDVYYCPTHLTRRWEAYLDDEDFLADDRLAYVPIIQRLMWKMDQWMMLRLDKTEIGRTGFRSFYKQGLIATRDAHGAGVKILAGTDALDSYIFYGFSLHDELAELVKAGLTPADALQTATLNAAEFLGVEQHYGSVKKGKVADLLILSRNPLQDISNTKRIEGILQGSRYYSADQLEVIKAFAKEEVSAFGTNSKLVITLQKSILLN
jgi:imidazolonepropionase-like amidohydrolase